MPLQQLIVIPFVAPALTALLQGLREQLYQAKQVVKGVTVMLV